MLKRNPEDKKLFQLYEAMSHLEVSSNENELLVDRFFSEFSILPKQDLIEFYLRINHALSLSFESKVKNRSKNNSQLQLFCGIFQYLIWNSIKHHRNQLFPSNPQNQLFHLITNRTFNYLNCSETDIRINDFSHWVNIDSSSTLMEIQDKTWFNLQYFSF